MPPKSWFDSVTLNGIEFRTDGTTINFDYELPAGHNRAMPTAAWHKGDFLHNIPTHVIVSQVTPERIVRNGPATIVFWKDGTKTVVKCHDEDYDPEKGLAMALCRKLWGRCQTERYVRMVEEQVGR